MGLENIKRIGCALLLGFVLVMGNAQSVDTASLAWFKDAKFGLFLHWGLYSQTAGDWKGHPAKGGEHFMLYERIPLKEYALIANDFNPACAMSLSHPSIMMALPCMIPNAATIT